MTDKTKETPNTLPPPNNPPNDQNLTEIIQSLRLKLQETTDPELQTTKEKFDKIYERLPETATHIIEVYKSVCKRYRLNPGKIRLYMVGGRVKGNPLKKDSDIDLIFCVENFRESPSEIQFNRFSDPDDAADAKTDRMQLIIEAVSKLCKEMDIPNEFHILSFGTFMPNESPKNALLLAEG